MPKHTLRDLSASGYRIGKVTVTDVLKPCEWLTYLAGLAEDGECVYGLFIGPELTDAGRRLFPDAYFAMPDNSRDGDA